MTEEKLYVSEEIYNMIAGRKKLDQQIADAERDAENLEFLKNDIEKNNMHERHKEYFKDKEYKDLDWNEIHLLADVQKEEAEMQEREKNLSMSDIYQRLKKLRKDENLSSGFDDNSITNFPSTLDGLTDVINRTIDVIEEMVVNSSNKWLNDRLIKIQYLLYQMREIRENPNEKPEEQDTESGGQMPRSSHSPVRTEIENQAPVTVSKNQKLLDYIEKLQNDTPDIEEYQKYERIKRILIETNVSKNYIKKSDDIIEGFCSVEITDSQNDVIPIKVLQKALPSYLEHGTICLGHAEHPIGKVIYHDFRKTWDGHDGLYIKCKLFPSEVQIIQKMIDTKQLTGFSIAGVGTAKQNCDKIKCWKNIEKLNLWSISLVGTPANREAILT